MGTFFALIGTFLGTQIRNLRNTLLGNVPAAGDNLNKLYELIIALQAAQGNAVTMQQVNDAVQAIVGAAPDALNTLQEIAQALDNNETFAASITNLLTQKVNTADLGTTTEFQDAYTTAFNA